MAFSISIDEEHYDGKYDTLEEALQEASHGYAFEEFWVGEIRKPRQPETFLDVDHLLDDIGDGDEEWSMDCCDWDISIEDRSDLQSRFKKQMTEWLDERGLRPTWFVIDRESVTKYVVVDGKPVKASDVELSS